MAERETEAGEQVMSEGDVDTTEAPGNGGHLLRRLKMPDVYVVLVGIMLLAALATYLIPSGVFDRVPGPDEREQIDPESFRRVDQTPVSPMELMTAIPRGIIDAIEVVVFTLMIGGTFMVLRATGIIEILVARLAHSFSRRGLLAIPVLMLVFAAIATMIGTQELALVYVPVIIPLLIALGFDSLTAAAVALCATTAGFATGVINPINTGLAQTIAGIELYSGMGLRIVAFILVTTFAMVMVMRYARRVRNDPSASFLAGDPKEEEKRRTFRPENISAPKAMTGRQRVGSITVLVFMVILVWGVLDQGWFMLEMTGLFIVMGVVVGKIAGLSLDGVAAAFNQGFREVLVGALIAGVARAIAVVLEDGQILDTIVHALGSAVGDFPPVLSATGMFGIQTVINFLIPSGSGQALVTMPIMAPLADLLDITRQTSVLAYQMGDGMSNILFPTSGYFMATLALAGVPWQKWLKFYLPLYLGWTVIAVGLLVFAQVTNWS